MTDHPEKPRPARWLAKFSDGSSLSYEDEEGAREAPEVAEVVPLYEHPPAATDAKPDAYAPKMGPACLSLAHQHGALRAILEVVTMDAALLANNMDLDATDLRAELQAIARRCAHVLELLDTCPTNPLAQATCDDYPRETP